MPGEDPRPSQLSRLVSVPGILALAVLGVVIVGISRLFGAEIVLREVVTEVIASFGSAILLLAVFALVFRTGIERLVRRAPGGDLYARSTERLRDLLEDLDQGQEPDFSGLEERLSRIEQSVSGLSDRDIPALRNELRELRQLMLDEENRQGD